MYKRQEASTVTPVVRGWEFAYSLRCWDRISYSGKGTADGGHGDGRREDGRRLRKGDSSSCSKGSLPSPPMVPESLSVSHSEEGTPHWKGGLPPTSRGVEHGLTYQGPRVWGVKDPLNYAMVRAHRSSTQGGLKGKTGEKQHASNPTISTICSINGRDQPAHPVLAINGKRSVWL